MDISAALPTFVVTLREGFEAALVVGIILACLQKAQQSQLTRWVYLGIGGGVVASVMVGWLLWNSLNGLESSQGLYAPVVRELLQVLFGTVAIALLSWMLLWMTQQAKSMKSEVEGAITTALQENQAAGKAIFLLVFVAVLREGFETVLFMVAKFQQEWQLPAVGAIAGLTLAVAMAVLLFKWGVKINLRLFFQVMGVLLLLIVGGLVIGVFKHVDGAIALLSQLNPNYAAWCFSNSTSCILGSQVWDASGFLPDKEFPGIILKALFGYRDKLYLVQAVGYVLFLAIVGGFYFQSLGINSVVKPKSAVSEQ